jgi:ubiquinone/menaquinone biosynthesis C-methylase UbiE
MSGVDTNLAWWEERAALHGQDGAFYDIEGFLAGGSALTERERSEVEAAIGEVGGKDLLHVQCHIGLGTLSFARLGAVVTGVDFSPTAIRRAGEIAQRAGLSARFVVADARALPAKLDERFDCVFASYGVLVWIDDLSAWMSSATRSMRHGGSLVLVEGHPLLSMVRSTDPVVLEDPYGAGASRRR